MSRLLILTLLISLCYSSCWSSILSKSLVRRQVEPQNCHAIEGFDCKCSYYRATCTNDRDLSSPIQIIANEKGKYQSVELVLTAARDIHVDDRTFESVKDLFKSDADNLEFRVKFEKFTALHLSSPAIFNRVFPENLSSNVRKHIALEIYNPEVQPKDDVHLFQNLNVDTLELYALYPFHGSFQQLFNGANIKYLRLSGGDIRSDLSQSFTGNIARLELAKQANSLSAQNFPVYPAHELIINAFYITEFNVDNPPNYQNLGELRIHSPDRIPANAFQQFSNIHTLSISTEKDIDPQAFNGLNHLEKLIIKDTKPSIELLNNVPQIKEFETSIEKLDERTQCQLLDKLANGQVSIQAIPNGRECTCISAYLDTAAGRTPCDAQDCEHSQCSAIKNNYDENTRLFKIPPVIRRTDGSDASRQREPKIYSSSYQISRQDQDKLQRAFPSNSPSESIDQNNNDNQDQVNNQPDNRPWSNDDNDQQSNSNTEDIHNDQSNSHQTNPQQYQDQQQQNQQEIDEQNRENDDDDDVWGKAMTTTRVEQENIEIEETTTKMLNNDEDDVWGGNGKIPLPVDEKDSNPSSSSSNQNGQVSGGNEQTNEDGKSNDEDSQRNNDKEENKNDEQTNDNRTNQDGNPSDNNNDGEKNVHVDGNQSDTAGPEKKKMSWLPIIIIIASILGLLLLGGIFLIIKKKRATKNAGYQQSATQEPARA